MVFLVTVRLLVRLIVLISAIEKIAIQFIVVFTRTEQYFANGFGDFGDRVVTCPTTWYSLQVGPI